MPQVPKFQPRNRNASVGVLRLPASGREGPPPKWPLTEKATPPERKIWGELWRTPQAVAWEDLGWIRVVARYARVALAAEGLDKDAMAEARQLEDRLGLTPKAMRLLLWKVETTEETSAPVVAPDRWREAS